MAECYDWKVLTERPEVARLGSWSNGDEMFASAICVFALHAVECARRKVVRWFTCAMKIMSKT